MRYAKSLATIGGLPEDSATSTCLICLTSNSHFHEIIKMVNYWFNIAW